ncbi:hypothetical protein [Leptolyngbya sp. FACHB-261]|uniref:hypothetical protein n=1 Tax=Leptolyngbya sp. FACHB-261 TaxID=2692806 RepID=UPI0016857AD6|nr:hypothetical protein [Leptolyngbya sp. FACHB-261]MBD2102011.1 hypothetical protein [Leptolyngbya sp. FACHB-261]
MSSRDAGDSTYAQIVQQLPLPTWQQSERFARFVSDAHSWYKHLPLYPKVPFVFYLDPHAGENLEANSRGHYTWQTTKTYRERFGFWNYFAPYGGSLTLEDGSISRLTRPGLKILLSTDDWVAVPPALQAAGTAYVNAMLHPMPSFHVWTRESSEQFQFSEALQQEYAQLPAQLPPELRGLYLVLRQEVKNAAGAYPAKPGSKLPAPLLAFIEEAVSDRFLSHAWEWPDQGWLTQIKGEGATEAMLPDVLQRVELERTLRWLSRFAAQKEEVFLQFFKVIARERVRQLVDMQKAMHRFVNAVCS